MAFLQEPTHCDGHCEGQTYILTWEEVISKEMNGVCVCVVWLEKYQGERRETESKEDSFQAATITQTPHYESSINITQKKELAVMLLSM